MMISQKLFFCILLLFWCHCAANSVQDNEFSMQDFNEAVKKNDFVLVRQYLSNNPAYDLEQKEEDSELVALHYSIDSNSPEMTKLLLENGADINAKNIGGYTALHLAVMMGQNSIRDVLLENNCEVDPMDAVMRSPLFYAIDMEYKESVEVLLQKGASCRNHDIDGLYPVHMAVLKTHDSTDILELVLNNGGSITVNNPDELKQRTSLHYAALNPSPQSRKLIGLLMECGADNGMEDVDELIPEDLADEKGHFATAELLRYYWSGKIETPLGKLVDLSKKASVSSSKIQAYVNFVLAMSKFSSISDEEIVRMGQKYQWTENFGNLDKHLDTAKTNAMEWDVTVYPALRSLYKNLDEFSQNYIQSYHKLEPKLRVMKMRRVDDAIIERDLEELEEFWIEEGFSASRRRFKKRKEKKRLKKQALDYDKGLDDIKSLFDYILTKADVYKSASDETVTKLSKFRTALLTDQTNFKHDFDWLNKTVFDKSANDFMELLKTTSQTEAKLGISSNRVDELKESIKDTLNRIKGWNIGAATISGLQGTVMVASQVGSFGKWYKGRSFVRHSVKEMNFAKHAATKRDNYQMKYDKAYASNNIKRMNKFEAKLTKWGNKISNPAANSNAAMKAQKSGKWLKRFGKLGKVMGVANVAMSFASMGFSIASSLALSREQERLEKLKQDFDEEIENYKQLTIDLMSSKDNLQKVTMTTESKLKASARVDKLLSKIQNAITEASKIRDTWIGISDEVIEMRNEAVAGKQYLANDPDKKIKFEYVFNYLNATTTDWKSIQGLAIGISNTFNP